MLHHGKTILLLGFAFLPSSVVQSADVSDCSERIKARRQGVQVMVHRGSADLAEENTLAAIELAFLSGGDGVEIDVQSTADGVLVLLHDPWVDRVLSDYGRLDEFSFDELRLLRFRRRGERGTRLAERVPRVSEALQLVRQYCGLLHLDIKSRGVAEGLLVKLREMKLTPNVVTVNPHNSRAILNAPDVTAELSLGSLIHGSNDFDLRVLAGRIKGKAKGTLLVDDARPAASALRRKLPPVKSLTPQPPPLPIKESSEELLARVRSASSDYQRRRVLARLILKYPQETMTAVSKAFETQQGDDAHPWLWALARLARREVVVPKEMQTKLLSLNSKTASDVFSERWATACGELKLGAALPALVNILRSRARVDRFAMNQADADRFAARIRVRAAAARAIGLIGKADGDLVSLLEKVIAERSLHFDGAYQGLDGGEAVKALGGLKSSRSVGALRAAILRIDPALDPIKSRSDYPWWLRRESAWWDFRVKTEALQALAVLKTAAAKNALLEFLKLDLDHSAPVWRELYWDSARALVGGWAPDAKELEGLLRHHDTSVRRTASVYLVEQTDEAFTPLKRKFAPWSTEQGR